MLDFNQREEWQDDVKAFVPAFAPVRFTQIAEKQDYSATMTLDRDGKLAIQILDEDETQEIMFRVDDLLDVDIDALVENWEQYIGMLEIAHQFQVFANSLLNKIDEVRDAMDERGLPMNIDEAKQHLED